jgi:hypothetical protein
MFVTISQASLDSFLIYKKAMAITSETIEYVSTCWTIITNQNLRKHAANTKT